MGEIIKRKNVNDHDKNKLNSDALQNYVIVKEQNTHTGNLSLVVTQTTPFSMYSNTSILETVHKNTRHARKTMLRFLRQSGKLHWKDDGRVSYQDREITDNSIADLINDRMRNRNTFNPRESLPFTEKRWMFQMISLATQED